MKQTAKIVLAWELFQQHIPKGHIADQLDVNRETVRIWIRGIEEHAGGLSGFLESYECAKKGERAKRKVDGLLKARIYRLRGENRQCYKLKIQQYLIDEFSTYVSVPAI